MRTLVLLLCVCPSDWSTLRALLRFWAGVVNIQAPTSVLTLASLAETAAGAFATLRSATCVSAGASSQTSWPCLSGLSTGGADLVRPRCDDAYRPRGRYDKTYHVSSCAAVQCLV